MSYIWLSFCSESPYCLEFSTTSNSHAARKNLPRLVASEIFPKYGNAVEWEKTIANRFQRADKVEFLERQFHGEKLSFVHKKESENSFELSLSTCLSSAYFQS